MSRRESKVELNYIDTQYSSGDSNTMKSKQHYKEENNNEIDELSKNLTDMGCIVDAVKRPPNICVEHCIYESDYDETYKDDDAYSDEFEEDKEESDGAESEETSVETQVDSEKIESTDRVPSGASVKLIKSQSSMSSNKMSVSGRSTDYGSISVPKTRRNNMSFTNERLREIERHNHILLSKILSAKNKSKSSIPAKDQSMRKPVPPAAVMRKNQQRQIDLDNMILLKKIQSAKSSSYSIRR